MIRPVAGGTHRPSLSLTCFAFGFKSPGPWTVQTPKTNYAVDRRLLNPPLVKELRYANGYSSQMVGVGIAAGTPRGGCRRRVRDL